MTIKKNPRLPSGAEKSQAPAVVDPEVEKAAAERARVHARITLSSYSSAALIADAYKTFSKVDIQELQKQLGEQCRKVQNGELGRAGSMLISQAHSLDVIFTKLALDASVNMQSNIDAAERYLKLALKAQSQCRATLETLAAIKNPPIFAKQANISHGHQQVNNGSFQTSTHAHARAEEIPKQPNELLEHDHGEQLDTRTASKAGRGDQAMATVATIHRPSNRKRQSQRQP